MIESLRLNDVSNLLDNRISILETKIENLIDALKPKIRGKENYLMIFIWKNSYNI
jgi:hypothetical protein